MTNRWIEIPGGCRFKFKSFNFRDLIVDWEGIIDKDGKAVDNRDDLYNVLDELPYLEDYLRATYSYTEEKLSGCI